MQLKQPLQIEQNRCSTENLIQVEYLPAQAKNTYNVSLVFIAGWASSNHIWAEIQKSFNSHHDCYVWSLPGNEPNSKKASEDVGCSQTFSLTNLLENALNLLPEKCLLLGWSLGGMLATRLAFIEAEKVQGLITFSSNLQFVADKNWPAAMSAETFEAFSKNFHENPQACLKRFQALQYKGDSAARELKKYFAEHTNDCSSRNCHRLGNLLKLLGEISNVEIFRKITQAGLHFFGGDDALVPLTAANAIFELQQQDQSIKIYPNCGHLPQWSQQQDVIAEIEKFILRKLAVVPGKNPYGRDKDKIALAFSAAARTYDSAAGLQKKCAEHLLEFLEPLSVGANVHNPGRINRVLDIGCGTGFVSEGLLEKCAVDTLLLLDLSANMLHCAREKLLPRLHFGQIKTLDSLCMDMDMLSLEDNSLDLAISNMSVQWSEDFSGLLTAVWRSLKPGASFIFSSVGAGTLYELDEAWRAVDDYVHVNKFLSEPEILQATEAAHFICEQHRREQQQQFFPNVIALMKSLKTVGAHNVNAGQNRGLTGRARLISLEKHYEKFRTPQGLPASWELHYLKLKKPDEH